MKNLRKGDTIKCKNKTELINLMQSLTQEGIETDFCFNLDGINGFYLVVTKSTRRKAKQ